MLEAKTTDEYTTYYDNFVLRYQVSHPDFVEYFKTNYGKRAHEWALCYRTHEYANVNTNMFVESFHNKLKTIYFDRKLNRRLDRLIAILLQIENHMYIDHLKRVTYNTNTSGVSSDRHNKSLQISDESVQHV